VSTTVEFLSLLFFMALYLAVTSWVFRPKDPLSSLFDRCEVRQADTPTPYTHEANTEPSE